MNWPDTTRGVRAISQTLGVGGLAPAIPVHAGTITWTNDWYARVV